jgi:hypothetical protein
VPPGMFSMVIVEISAESVKACSFHQRQSIPDTEIIYSTSFRYNALTDSADISTITIENMPGGTPWGQAQLRIFDRKFLPALKITKLVFFFLILRLLDTIGSQIVFFLNFYRNLPQYPCCSIRATDKKIDK